MEISGSHNIYLIRTDENGIITYKNPKCELSEKQLTIYDILTISNIKTLSNQSKHDGLAFLNNTFKMAIISHVKNDNEHEFLILESGNIIDNMNLNDIFNILPVSLSIIDTEHDNKIVYTNNNSLCLKIGDKLGDHLDMSEIEISKEQHIVKHYDKVQELNTLWTFVTLSENNPYVIAISEVKQHERHLYELFLKLIHDLKTPLNAILGFNQLISMSDSEEERKEYTGIINQSGSYLYSLISDFDMYSKINLNMFNLTYEWHNLKNIISEVMDMLQFEINTSGITIISENTDILIWCDMSKFKQIMTNLMSNAVKYNVPNGYVTIKFENNSLSITDSGIGISKDKLMHIGEPFNRLGADRLGISGTGLGIYIICKLVQLHKWSMIYASQENIGTTITIQNMKNKLVHTE